MMQTVNSPRARAGFTLVEILTVLGILAVLAAILLPVIGRVKERGRYATCLSNLHQLGLATQQYVSDNNGSYPSFYSIEHKPHPDPPVWWNDLLMPYLKNPDVFYCPSHFEHTTIFRTDYSYNRFQLNDVVSDGITTPPFSHLVGAHEARVMDATRTVLVYDDSWRDSSGASFFGERIYSSCLANMWAANLHSGGANFAYADGHVKWLSVAAQNDLDCAMFHQSHA